MFVRCSKCNRRVKQPPMETLVSEEGSGITVLGRITPRSVVMNYWTCPKCGEPTLESFSVPLDTDWAVITAYEKAFGPADELARKALSVLNNQLIADLGENWQEHFDNYTEFMIVGVINTLKEQYGDEWAKALIEIGVSFVKDGEH